ncbi:hypothetical protein [Chroococcidiopsis thermalis]|nr:hypothetical protein [Chroococcidiopsis thermalis]
MRSEERGVRETRERGETRELGESRPAEGERNLQSPHPTPH